MFDLWREMPPVHEAVRRIGIGLGIEQPPAAEPPAIEQSPPSSGEDPSGIGDLIKRFPAGFVPVDR